jgi:hypothetical protein
LLILTLLILFSVELNNLKALLKEFVAEVVSEAQKNIGATQRVSKFKVSKTISKNFVASGKLKDGLRGKVNSDLSLSFYVVGSAKQYAMAIEHGQKGTKGMPTDDPYYMPSKNATVAKMPPSKMIFKWMERKNIKFRDKDGKFIQKPSKSRREGIAYAIAKAIQERGRVGLHYFEYAYLDTLKVMGPDILTSVGKDIEVELLNTFRIVKKA